MTRIGLILTGVATLALSSCGNKAPETSATTADQADNFITDSRPDYTDKGKQFAWMELGKQTLRDKLRDPDSAVFRNEAFFSGGIVPVVCGEVNSKNGFGGMTGFQRFFAAGDKMAVIESEMADGEMQKMWDKLCK